MSSLKAVLWDVDGTLAETERDGHRVAFNQAFAEHGLPWQWDEARYGDLLRITGGRERLLHDMSTRADAPRCPTSARRWPAPNCMPPRTATMRPWCKPAACRCGPACAS
jgi:phosphoglycolate phosphatase-like HAD superfamily hydrolase